VAYISLLTQTRELERQLAYIASNADIDTLGHVEQELMRRIKQQAIDARLETQEYEYAESRALQTKAARLATKRLEQLQQDIIEASKHGLFSAIDVALLSASVQQIIAGLE